MVNLWSHFTRLTFFVAPGACILCENQCDDSLAVCDKCQQDLQRTNTSCICCGRETLAEGFCTRCISKSPPVDRTLCPYKYSYPASLLIKTLKYNQKINIAKQFAEALTRKILKENNTLPEAILPVPLHPLRLLKRGFNQSEEIARFISKRLSVPLDCSLLVRRRSTRPQYKLSSKERRRNIKNAFALTHPSRYQSVAVVDDIITSGATINEIAKTLKGAGLKHVSAWACLSALQKD